MILANPASSPPAAASAPPKKEQREALDEARLWQDFKNGSEEAYALIYRQYSALLYNYGNHIHRDPELVKDCIQELFVELWDRRSFLSDTDSIRYYLFRCLKRKITDELIARKKFSDEDVSERSFAFVLPHDATLIHRQLSDEQKRHLLEEVNKLSARQREAIYLLFYQELTYPEVASIMSLKVKTVYNLIYNGLEVLRKQVTRFTFSLAPPLLLLLWRLAGLLA